MRLILLHPKVAFRDCADCLRWQYDEDKGEVKVRHGKPLGRICQPPCEDPRLGCAKGHFRNPNELSEKNLRAWGHYLECRAVGKFPEDATVRQNAGIIRSVENAIERAKRDQLLSLMRAVTLGLGMDRTLG